MFEAAIERSEPIWQFIDQYQTFLAGWLTLIAGLFALAAAWAIVKEGKRQRAFKMNQHDIEMQTNLRTVAVMLAADIRSIVEMANLKAVSEIAKDRVEKFNFSDDAILIVHHFIPPIGKSFLNNYSHYIENTPPMCAETVEAVSRFYFCATRLSEVTQILNATIEKEETKSTRVFSQVMLANVSVAADDATIQSMKTLPWLEAEVKEAEKELDRLKIVQEKLTQRPRPSTRPRFAGATQDEGGGKQTP